LTKYQKYVIIVAT